MSETSRFGVGTMILIASGLTLLGVLVASRAPASKVAARAVQNPQLVSMQDSAQAMRRAGNAMKAHGQSMLDEGQSKGDKELAADGQHWLNDGQTLVQNGDWMDGDPTAPQSLHSSRGNLQAQGSWAELTRQAQTMLHDPTGVTSVDLEALSANGQAMLAEGRTMSEHGKVMSQEAESMVARHNLQGQEATDLRDAAQVMQTVSASLQQNGQQMVDYADRINRGLGK